MPDKPSIAQFLRDNADKIALYIEAAREDYRELHHTACGAHIPRTDEQLANCDPNTMEEAVAEQEYALDIINDQNLHRIFQLVGIFERCQ